MTLPEEVNTRLEEVINDWLSKFDELVEGERDFLEKIGIEPTLETMLSYTAGVLDSLVGSIIHGLYDRGMTGEEDKALIELIKRRIPELEMKINAFLRGNDDADA